MALDHVSYLVAERSRELIESVSALYEPAVHVDVPARKRERVHLRSVDHIEMPVEIRAARITRDLRSQLLDVSAHGRIGYDRQLCVHLICVLPAERNLLIL